MQLVGKQKEMTISLKSSRIGFTIVLLCALGQCVQTSSSGAAQSQSAQAASTRTFSVTLTAVQDLVQAGSPVKVRIVTTNTSNHQLSFWVENAEDQAGWAYAAMVHDEKGNAPP